MSIFCTQVLECNMTTVVIACKILSRNKILVLMRMCQYIHRQCCICHDLILFRSCDAKRPLTVGTSSSTTMKMLKVNGYKNYEILKIQKELRITQEKPYWTSINYEQHQMMGQIQVGGERTPKVRVQRLAPLSTSTLRSQRIRTHVGRGCQFC